MFILNYFFFFFNIKKKDLGRKSKPNLVVENLKNMHENLGLILNLVIVHEKEIETALNLA